MEYILGAAAIALAVVLFYKRKEIVAWVQLQRKGGPIAKVVSTVEQELHSVANDFVGDAKAAISQLDVAIAKGEALKDRLLARKADLAKTIAAVADATKQ